MMLRLILAGVVLCAAALPRSGYDDASPPVRAMQDDDASNPGFLWVEQGKAMWNAAAGSARKSCADCHEVAAMRGVAARYPAYDAALGRIVTLEQRINLSRTAHEGAAALPQESDELLAIAAFVSLQSRGMPMHVDVDGPAQPFRDAGETIFRTRMGQLDLSCAQCHEALAGKRLGGALIPQGQPNGYPLYRLEWQNMGSLFRRIRDCLAGVRAEPFPADSPDLANLEFFLAARADGLKMESPAIRP